MSTIASPRGSTTINSRRTSASTDTTTSRGIGTTPSHAPTQPSSRRNRAALRDYYNLKSPLQTATSSPVSSPLATTFTENDDADNELDRPDFDAKGYVTRLISSASQSQAQTQAQSSSTLQSPTASSPSSARSKSQPQGPKTKSPTKTRHSQHASTSMTTPSPLRTLLQTEAKLVSEIRQFDAERKALVYDNYSKLIAASDTIGLVISGGVSDLNTSSASLSNAVPGDSRSRSGSASVLGSNSDKNTNKSPGAAGLVPVLEQIVAFAVAINDAHGPTQSTHESAQQMDTGASEIRDERMIGGAAAAEDAQILAKKEAVSWVLDAPRRLADLKSKGRMEEVDAEWRTVEGMLGSWEGVGGVEELRNRCLEVIGRAD